MRLMHLGLFVCLFVCLYVCVAQKLLLHFDMIFYPRGVYSLLGPLKPATGRTLRPCVSA